MNTAIDPSILVLTSLLAVGLFFFIRASVKDRTQEVKLVSEQAEAALMPQLHQYFTHRSYRVATVDPEQKQVTFEGFVRPSVFLAIFLTLLAAVGILCLALVISLLSPGIGQVFLELVLLSPGVGVFYWKKAGRSERVLLKMETVDQSQPSSQITVVAHRDEVLELRRALKLQLAE